MNSRHTLLAVASFSLLVPGASASTGSEAGRAEPIRIAVKPQEPQGYKGNPSTLVSPLRQDLTELALTRLPDGRYRFALGPVDGGPTIGEIDLRSFVPRVPALAKGDPTLTKIALIQREFNRNETRYDGVTGTDGLKLANNCLRQGMWEVMTEKKLENGSSALAFHGWFTFPPEEYARLFEEINGIKYADHAASIAQYPAVGGFPVPLEKLRKVTKESDVQGMQLLRSEAPLQLPEQKRKAKLVLTSGIATYADYVAKEKQPITTAKFSEPGYYDLADPVRFDLAWLASPVRCTRRSVESISGAGKLGEVEIAYANGYRLLLGDAGLPSLVARTERPQKDAEVLRLTFGISTPEIYASPAERAQEIEAPRPYYLMLLDAQGNHLDNHTIGLDRAFVWREQGTPDTLHLGLVGYERIAIVSELSVPWSDG